MVMELCLSAFEVTVRVLSDDEVDDLLDDEIADEDVTIIVLAYEAETLQDFLERFTEGDNLETLMAELGYDADEDFEIIKIEDVSHTHFSVLPKKPTGVKIVSIGGTASETSTS